MLIKCVKDYKIPVFEDGVFMNGENYELFGMSDLPEGGIDAIVIDEYGEKWGFIMNKGDEIKEMYVYSDKKKKGYIGTGKLFYEHFKK
jgi:hypothetical protein